jgi:hypothetical protein
LSSYKVAEREKGDVWESDKGGSMQSWNLKLIDGQGEYECQANTKLGNEFPAIGEDVEGEIKRGGPGQPNRFKKAYTAPTPGASKGWQPKSPEERIEERRRSAQIRAIELLAVEVSAGMKFENEKASELLKPRITFFFDDLESVLP